MFAFLIGSILFVVVIGELHARLLSSSLLPLYVWDADFNPACIPFLSRALINSPLLRPKSLASFSSCLFPSELCRNAHAFSSFFLLTRMYRS